MALSLFGVAVNDVHAMHTTATRTELVTVRDLAAICAPFDGRNVDPDDAAVLRHNDVIAEFSARGPVLPAPAGVTFRSSDAVARWLELHYSALTDALAFVENRVAARVHVFKAGAADDRENNTDAIAVASESLRALRPGTAGTVGLRPDQRPGVLLSAAFLVDAERWQEFAAQVEDRGRQSASVRFELTGPWPPYDFVQMQLGA